MALRFSTALRNQRLGDSAQHFTAPTNITGVTINYSLANAAGAGTLAFTASGTTLTWAPFGGSAGTAINIGTNGKYVIPGSAGLLVITVVAASLPGTDKTDTITITTAGGEGLAGAFYKSFIDLYSGAPPANADAAPTGTKLATVSLNGDGVTGLTFGTPTGGTVDKTSTEHWQATGLSAGTIGWFRLRTASDDLQAGTTYPRIDGLVAKTGADLNMSNTTTTIGSPHSIDRFLLTDPAT